MPGVWAPALAIKLLASVTTPVAPVMGLVAPAEWPAMPKPEVLAQEVRMPGTRVLALEAQSWVHPAHSHLGKAGSQAKRQTQNSARALCQRAV